MVPLPTARIGFLAFALLATATAVSAQTIVQWQANASGAWFSNANWSTSLTPTNLQRAALTTANTVTASGTASASVLAFDVGATGALALFDYTSNSYGLQLGNATSNWTAGTVEFRTSYGLYGNGAANTTLNLSSGVELLYSTSAFTSARNLYNLTVNNAGTIHATNAPLAITYANLTNQAGGLIHADGTGISFGAGAALNNLGTIRASGTAGQVTFGNNLTTANLGAVDLVGGAHAYLTGTLNNTSATLNAPTGGSYELQGGTITGGSIANGAVKFSTFTSKLDGASLQDDLTLGASERLTLTGGATFTGGNATLGPSATLTWQQAATLTGKTITLANGSLVYVNGVNSALTLGSGTSVTGDLAIYSDGSSGTAITNQGSLTHTSSSGGTIYAQSLTNSGTITNSSPSTSLSIGSTSSGYNTTNTGTITVNASGATVYLDGNVDNTGGILNATVGQLVFRGNNTAANLNGGTLNIASGAHAYLNGTIDNTLDNSPTTLAAPASGKYELYGGRITGGTIASGALTFTSSGGYLDGATLNEDLTLPASTHVRLTGGATFTGANATLGNASTVYWQQAGTLNGKAITLGSNSSLSVAGGNSTLTLGSATTVTGDLNIHTDGSTGTAITNQGSLTHTSNSSGSIYAQSLTNSGTITNSAANTALSIGSTSSGYNTTNTGNITVNATGATVYLDGNVNNTGGVLDAITGQLIFRGNNTTANLNGGTLNIASGAHAYLNGTLDNTTTTLAAPASGRYELYGGTIRSGTIAPGALTFTSSGGYLDGVTLNEDLTLPDSAHVRLTGGTTFTGGNATLGNSSTLYWQQTGTLTGKSVSLASGSLLYVVSGNSTLTLDTSTSVTGDLYIVADGSTGTAITNRGTLTHTDASSGSIYASTLANSGTITNGAANATLSIGNTASGYATTNTGNITVNATGATVYVDGNVNNTGGILNAIAGQLIFRGTNTTSHLNGGTLNILSGAHAYLNGLLDNTAALLNAPASGKYELYGGTIQGGTIAPNALTFTASGGYLDGATLNEDLTLPASTYVRLTGGATFSGTNATLGNSSTVQWQQAGTLAGKTLTLGANSYLYVTGGNSTLTFGSTTSVTGDLNVYTDGSIGTAITNQGSLTHTSSSSGSIYAPSFANSGTIANTTVNAALSIGSNSSGYTTRNTGTITVEASGAWIYLDGDVDNTGGTLNATAGQFSFRGNNTTGHLNGGTLNIASGAHAYLNGTLDNTSATLNAPASGTYELYGGTINNGSIAAGALSFTSTGGTLNGVSLLGNVTLPTGSHVYWKGGTNLGSANALLTLGGNGGVYWQQSGSLAGTTLNFGSNAYLYLSGANTALTLDSATTGTGDVEIYSDGSAGTTLTNQGTLTHTTGSGYLYAQTFTNAGTINVTGGTMYLGTGSTGATVANNAGATLRLNGGNLALQQLAANPLVNNGVIDIRSGTFYTNGRLTNGATGTIQGAGVILGDLVVSGGVIAPGNNGIGALSFNSGTLTVAGPATFAVDISGSSSDQLVFQYPTGAVDLGSGLLSLSINLLSAPTAASTYNLITIGSGSHGILGTFAGLANNGDLLTASFNGTPFTFSINYQPNFVSLAYNPVVVPEPSTYALVGLGMLVLVFTRRRALAKQR